MRTMLFSVQVEIMLRDGVSDAEGAATERSLPQLGFDGISGVRIGRSVRFRLEAADEGSADAAVQDLCDRFLTNPAIEDATISIEADGAA